MTRTEFYKIIGANVRRRRRALDLTQVALGVRLGSASPHNHKIVCKIEHGLSSIDLWRLIQLARALHCSPTDLLPSVIKDQTR